MMKDNPHKALIFSGISTFQRYWLRILNLDYDLRGPKAIKSIMHPFGHLIELDLISVGPKASQELILPFL
jgi:hypothetical protein